MEPTPKPLHWVGSSLRDVREFPSDVRQSVGFALWQAQRGAKHPDAKVLKGFGGAGVLEVVACDEGGTYRAVYTVKFAGSVYVLHAFQKKSTRGIKTATADIETIRRRLSTAEAHHEANRSRGSGRD